MLIREAEQLGAALCRLPDTAFPLANIGSQSSDFRQSTQPWIERSVFAPLSASGRRVVNVDLVASPGVDLVADATSAAGRAQVGATGVRSVLCSNLLEHVDDPVLTLNALAELVPAGGFLVVSGPLDYPYHPDPIDNGFRPRAAEVAAMLGEFRIERAADLRCRRLVRYDLNRLRQLALGRRRKSSHISEMTGATTRGVTLRRLALRLLWTLRRPSFYLVIAQRRVT